MNCAGTACDRSRVEGQGRSHPAGRIDLVMAEAHQPDLTPSFGPNAWLVDEMYEQFRRDPSSVSESWQEFFADYRRGDEDGSASGNGSALTPTPAAPPAAAAAATAPAAAPPAAPSAPAAPAQAPPAAAQPAGPTAARE